MRWFRVAKEEVLKDALVVGARVIIDIDENVSEILLIGIGSAE